MDLKSIDKKLMKEFQIKKLKAEMLAEKNRKRAFLVPAFSKLDALEKQMVFEVSKLKASGKKDAELEKTLKQAQSEKQKILKALKLSEKNLTAKYECKTCSDSGFVNGQMCDCYKKRRNAEIVKACGLNPDELVTFEKFNTDIIKNKTQAETLSKLKNKLQTWAESYPNIKKQNIVLSGKTGVGKTFISECLASEMIKKGYSVCFVSAFEMNNMMLRYHTTFGANKHAELVPLLESDFLFVDDLGTEPIINNVTLNYLFLVLSERERFGRPVIITTNLSPENILDRYNERVYSRITNKIKCAIFNIDGNDLRVQK